MTTFYDELKRMRLVAGLEDIANGTINREIEYCIYAEMDDVSELSSAYHVEKQEQWRIPLLNDERLRARIRAVNDREWTLTTKSNSDDVIGEDEVTILITKEAYDQWKMAACDGYIKHRHKYRTSDPTLIWEVDVFKSKLSGQTHPWVKLDLEVKDVNQEVPKLPFGVKRFIIMNKNAMKLADRLQVKMLWDKEWARLDDDESIDDEISSNPEDKKEN